MHFNELLKAKKHSALLLLAPMEGITNFHFRDLIQKYAPADIVATEFIRITGPKQGIKALPNHNCPLQVQLMASSAEDLSSSVKFLKLKKIITDDTWIDLNVGCPSKRVNAHGAGAALLCTPNKLTEIIKALRAVHSGTLSIKTRVGYQSAENFPQILEELANAPLDFISIHARTKQAGYTEPVNYEYLKLATKTLPYPVIGNGEIWNAEDAIKLLNTTAVAGLMCGRGAISNPYIFSDIRKALNHEAQIPNETRKQELINFSLELLKRYQEKPKNIGLFKEFSFWLSRNPLIGKIHFDQIKRMQNFEEIESYLKNVELL
jgi:tRNA-dihydrouridine synthase B